MFEETRDQNGLSWTSN